jgi:PadR family transcriptional regulator PadR
MNIENTKAQMRKGVLEFCILSVLKERCIYIRNTRHFKKCKILVVEGTIYPINTIKNDGLLRKLPLGELPQDRRKY